MAFVSLHSAREVSWSFAPHETHLEFDIDRCATQHKLTLLQKIADLRSRHLFQSEKPNYFMFDPFSAKEKELQALEQFCQALDSESTSSAKTTFSQLPQKLRSTLMWAVWFHDHINKKPIFGDKHGENVINSNPLALKNYSLPIIHSLGGSLAKQLYHLKKDLLHIGYQKYRASQFFASDAEKAKASNMELAHSLLQYQQYKVLSPYVKINEHKKILRSKFSPQTLKWIDEIHKEKALHAQPAYFEVRGAHYLHGTTSFSLYAPNAQAVECILINPCLEVIEMEKSSDGVWFCQTDDAPPGKMYRYRIHTKQGHVFEKIDPFSFCTQPTGWAEQSASVVVDRLNYKWNDNVWLEKRRARDPLQSPLSIYEVHVKSWCTSPNLSLKDLADKIVPYCHMMGFTHIELYGLMNHFWKDAVSYSVTNYFSIYRSLGSYNDLKFFIDHLHQNNIGVILDWIPCHYDHGQGGQDHFSSSLHYLDGTDLYSDGDSMWGTAFFHCEKIASQELLKASALWWVQEFHFDGLRIDAVSQMIRRRGSESAPGIHLLRSITSSLHTQFPGVLMIAEATDWDPRICEPVHRGGLGFDLNWSCGVSGDLRNYMKTPVEQRGHPQHHAGKIDKIFEELRRENEKKIFSHSHDDTDQGLHNAPLYVLADAHSLNEYEKFSDVRNFFSFQIFGPNWGHLIHMGEELGQRSSWASRFSRGLSGVEWDCVQDAGHRGIQSFVKDAIHYYKEQSDFWRFGAQAADLFYSYGPNSVIAYSRGDRHIIIHNFSDKKYPSYSIDVPEKFKGANFHERINSCSEKYGGDARFTNHQKGPIPTTGYSQKTITVSLAARVSVVLEKN